MPAILRPAVYETWLDPDNNNVSILRKILKRERITELSSFPIPKHGKAVHPAHSGAEGTDSTSRQLTFDWPEPR